VEKKPAESTGAAVRRVQLGRIFRRALPFA
jgi:hypothetical protein